MTSYISQGRVETPMRIGGLLCCSSVANLLQHLCAKNYQNTMQFDEVIEKIEGCIFCPTVYEYKSQKTHYEGLKVVLQRILPAPAMLCKRGLCRHAVFVCVSVTFVNCVKTNTDIFKKFSPPGSQAILVFQLQTAWQYSDGGVECRWGRQKS